MRAEEPGRIGALELPNRLVVAPMISNLANPDGSTNETHIAYLAARARGGAGLVITEYAFVNDRNARGSRNELAAHHPDHVPKLRRLTERLHESGSRAFLQLVHCGGRAALETNAEGPIAPSVRPYPGPTPREATAEELDEIVVQFGRAARLAERSGFDGVEVHGAHGYLIHQTLSPALNGRTDRYGGSFDARMRFVRDVDPDVRSSANQPVRLRLSLYEDDPDGYGPEYGLEVAEGVGGLDYVHFSAGRFGPPGSSASFYSPRLHVLARLPRRPRLTTMVVGSVLDREGVDAVLARADFVSVARGMLADADFARKVCGGTEALRPCIRCNQACRDLGWGEVRCTVNPDVGRESERVRLPRLRGEAVVVGAGPQGIEAALLLATTGLRVTLYEAEEAVGGQLRRITDEAKRRAFEPLVRYYERRLRDAGVTVATGTRYEGSGLYCRPAVEYPDLLALRPRSVDSNVFAHHDAILALAARGPLEVSERSLSSLDRARAAGYRARAVELGVRFVSTPDRDYDYVRHERGQYDLRAAIVSGRDAARRWVDERRPDLE